MSLPRLYLAGRITGSNWRESILGWNPECRLDQDGVMPWEPVEVDGLFLYTGPHHVRVGKDSKHGWWKESAVVHSHHDLKFIPEYTPGVNAHEIDIADFHLLTDIQRSCLSAIKSSYVFAWIDGDDLHGTVFELGVARAFNGPQEAEVWFKSEAIDRSHWLLSHTLFPFVGIADSPIDAWNKSFALRSFNRRKHCLLLAGKCESPIEQTVARFLTINCGLTSDEVIPQYRIGNYRTDFAIPTKKLVIECDGHEWHSSRDARTRDARRDRFLMASGWRVVRFTGTELHNESARCVRDLVAALSTQGVK